MKSFISIILLLVFISPAVGQSKKRDQVKRKYRNAETVTRELPQR